MRQQQAFPSEEYYGMDLRDYFAAKAMQGLISCPDWREEAGEDLDMDASKYTAITAYEMADAMMKARGE
jgi:hypothetical protein